jgi:hypothetical protein
MILLELTSSFRPRLFLVVSLRHSNVQRRWLASDSSIGAKQFFVYGTRKIVAGLTKLFTISYNQPPQSTPQYSTLSL